MFKFLPIQAKIAITLAVVALLGYSCWLIYDAGYNARTQEYDKEIADQKKASREKILQIEGKYNDSIKKLYSVPTNDDIAGPRTTYAIDSLYAPDNSK